ncbi:OsmC family peroxiredoxin [Paracoccus nototheniae]|uniref:OsmC family peroxiredoxin n=1 Tax=Paracoccus nototheniae TaxID=2489002 RepID=UPI0013F4134C|nr:OsmC family peroxiredoxin [Paracoccus nototheniae]
MIPVELQEAALGAALDRGIARLTPMLHFCPDAADVLLTTPPQDAPPRVKVIRYQTVVDSPETDQRLDPLHRDVLKVGTIPTTLSSALPLERMLARKV